jgi:hypothetical protein
MEGDHGLLLEAALLIDIQGHIFEVTDAVEEILGGDAVLRVNIVVDELIDEVGEVRVKVQFVLDSHPLGHYLHLPMCTSRPLHPKYYSQ